MRFGFFVLDQWLPEEDMSAKIGEAVEQVRAAREAGFDLIATGQHFLSYPYQMPTSLHFLARLAPEAQGMHLAATVLLLPLLSPVEVAESVATLDAISGGKFILGVGLGYREEEYIAFGSPSKERVPRLLESLEIMKLLWTEPEVEFHGRFLHHSARQTRYETGTEAAPPHLGGGQQRPGRQARRQAPLPLAGQPSRYRINRPAPGADVPGDSRAVGRR